MTLAVCLIGCGQQKTPPTAQTLRRGLSGEPSTLDPAAAADSFSSEVIQDLYEGLTDAAPNGDVVPGVASDWTVDPSGTEYLFHLRSGARWSNGKPVRAQDFVAAWRRVVDPKQGSPVADDLRLISGAASIIAGASPVSALGVEARGDDTLWVKLEQAAPYFPQILTETASYPIYSDASARSHDPKNWVSNGPYALRGWSPGTAVELIQNPYYWDRKSVHIPSVEFQVVSNENAQFARYRAGQLDLTDSVPANAVPRLRRENSQELVIAPFLAVAYYGLNLARPPFANNPSLRQAIAMAVDRRRLVDALAFGNAEAYAFVPPGAWNYSPQSWPWKELGDDGRIAEARRLYRKAGFSEEHPLKLRLLYNANPAIKNTAIIIASMWKQTLGIDIEMVEEEYRVFLQSRHDKSGWEIARLGWTADYNDAGNFLDVFRAHSNNNDADYVNPAFDTLLDQAAQTADPQRRRKILEASENLMLADYPIVPLYFYVSKRLVKPYIIGLKPNPLNRIYSRELSIRQQ